MRRRWKCKMVKTVASTIDQKNSVRLGYFYIFFYLQLQNMKTIQKIRVYSSVSALKGKHTKHIDVQGHNCKCYEAILRNLHFAHAHDRHAGSSWILARGIIYKMETIIHFLFLFTCAVAQNVEGRNRYVSIWACQTMYNSPGIFCLLYKCYLITTLQ